MIISGSFSALFLEELKTRLQDGAKKDITSVDHINIVLIHSMSIISRDEQNKRNKNKCVRIELWWRITTNLGEEQLSQLSRLSLAIIMISLAPLLESDHRSCSWLSYVQHWPVTLWGPIRHSVKGKTKLLQMRNTFHHSNVWSLCNM